MGSRGRFDRALWMHETLVTKNVVSVKMYFFFLLIFLLFLFWKPLFCKMALLSLKPNLLRHLLVNSNVRHLTTNKVAAQNVIPTWNAYFNLRKKRRTYEIVSYLPCTVIPAFGTFAYFAQMQVDPLTKILGMDPLMAAVVATIGAVMLKKDTLFNS